ncbi:MAG: DUF4349 domain-containing protein [Acidobacteriota bacterium]
MKITKLFALLLLAISAACGSGSLGSKSEVAASKEPSSASRSTANTSYSTVPESPAADKRAGGSGGNDGSTPGQPLAEKISLDQTTNTQNAPLTIDRKIIRNADLNLEADSPETSLQKITAIAESKGGFVVESQESSSDVKTTEHDTITMSVRVPSDKFNEALGEIRNAGNRVLVENVKGQDVTEEFIDIEARLKAEKALETQFIDIMKRANSVAEALNVQRELAGVRGEIEKIEGRKRFLENQSSLSTIKIRLQTPTVFSTSSTGFVYRLTQSFSTGFDFALNFILGLVTLFVAVLPFAVLIGLPGFFIMRYLWRRQSRPKSVSDIAKEELETD